MQPTNPTRIPNRIRSSVMIVFINVFSFVALSESNRVMPPNARRERPPADRDGGAHVGLPHCRPAWSGEAGRRFVSTDLLCDSLLNLHLLLLKLRDNPSAELLRQA